MLAYIAHITLPALPAEVPGKISLIYVLCIYVQYSISMWVSCCCKIGIQSKWFLMKVATFFNAQTGSLANLSLQLGKWTCRKLRPPPVSLYGFSQCTCDASLVIFSPLEVLTGPRPPLRSASFAFWLHAAARAPSGLMWLIGCHLSVKRSLAVCACSFNLFLFSSLSCSTCCCTETKRLLIKHRCLASHTVRIAARLALMLPWWRCVLACMQRLLAVKILGWWICCWSFCTLGTPLECLWKRVRKLEKAKMHFGVVLLLRQVRGAAMVLTNASLPTSAALTTRVMWNWGFHFALMERLKGGSGLPEQKQEVRGNTSLFTGILRSSLSLSIISAPVNIRSEVSCSQGQRRSEHHPEQHLKNEFLISS